MVFEVQKYDWGIKTNWFWNGETNFVNKYKFEDHWMSILKNLLKNQFQHVGDYNNQTRKAIRRVKDNHF